MKIERIRQWTGEADEGLCYAVGRDRDEIAAGVNSGGLELFRLWEGAAYMVTRTRLGTVTVCCYQGARLVEAAEWLFEHARRLGLRKVRFHTERPALARLLKSFSFEHIEHVFEARVR